MSKTYEKVRVKGTIGYPNVLAAQKQDDLDQDGNPVYKYGALIMIPKTDKETIKRVKEAILKVAKADFPKDKPAGLTLALKDGDAYAAKKEGREMYEGYYFIRSSSKNAPTAIALDGSPILSDKELSESNLCGFDLTLTSYAIKNKNSGVCAYLDGVVKTPIKTDLVFSQATPTQVSDFAGMFDDIEMAVEEASEEVVSEEAGDDVFASDDDFDGM